MSDHNTAESPIAIDDLTPEEANRIIHSHRKVRYGTACWPCRQRKVKCSGNHPCENCTKREHAALCSYKPNRSGPRGSAASEGSSIHGASSKKRAHESDDDEGGRGGAPPGLELKATESAIAAYSDNDNSEVSRYLGQNSIPAIIREQLPTNEQLDDVTHIRQDMRSLLGLDNSAPFPLMSPKHLDRLTQDIVSELPSDREVMKLFRTYKETPQQFWGFVIDINELESRLMVYLEDRAKNAKSAHRATKPVSASWLAILFAILAVGSQYHESPYHIRTANSQKYIQISFHFLRISNFLLRPNFDSIQAMLMTSFVLLNDMKAEASWALLGLTLRLAQSLGLDKHPVLDGKESPDVTQREMVRRKLWWTCVWHDSLTSLSFDRSPIANADACPIPIADKVSGHWEYLEGMYHLCKIVSQRLNPDALAAATYETILENCEITEAIRDKMIPQLRSKDACKSLTDRLHHFAIRLHTSFMVSVCCRPALHRGDGHGGNPHLTSAQKRTLADRCKVNLAETVRMFLAMHQLSVVPTRSWAFTYHGLSSAVLLGILGETKADPEVRQLQGDLISALSATAVKEAASPSVGIPHSDKDIELSGPLSRALTALRNIYDHGSVIGTNLARKEIGSGYASGSRTPHRFNALPAVAASALANSSSSGSGTAAGAASGAGSYTPTPGASSHDQAANHGLHNGGAGATAAPSTGTTAGMDPHQNAALAMAEMQNGASLTTADHIPPNGLPFVPQMGLSHDNSLVDPALIDPSQYMSPMDVYDQIFWESPDPWNTGMDQMNFDFLAHPPPGQPQQQQFYF